MFNAVVLPTSTNPNPQALTFSKSDDSSTVSTHQLTSVDRIAALEAEIYSLRARGPQKKFEGIRTRAQRTREGTEEEKKEAEEFDRRKVEPVRKPLTQKVLKLPLLVTVPVVLDSDMLTLHVASTLILPTPRDVIYSTVTSFLHIMSLLHSYVITPQLVSLLYIY